MSKRVRDSADIQSEIDHVTRQIDDADAQVRKAEDAVQTATSARDEAQAKVDETAEQLKCPDISEQERSALVAELQMRNARLITAQKDLERLSKREEQLREEELQLREEKLQLHKRELQLREEKLQLLKEEEQLNDPSSALAEQLLGPDLPAPPEVDALYNFMTTPPAAPIPVWGKLPSAPHEHFTAAKGDLASAFNHSLSGLLVQGSTEMFTVNIENTVVVSLLVALDVALPDKSCIGLVVERDQQDSSSMIAVTSPSGSSLRPDGVLRDQAGGRLLAKWEDKAQGLLDDAVNDLHKKTAIWTPLYYGNIKYLPCFAAAGAKLQFYAILAEGGLTTRPHPMSPTYDLTKPIDRARAVMATVKFYQLLKAQRACYPQYVLPAAQELSAKHPIAGFTRSVYFRTDELTLRKRVVPWERFAAWCGVSLSDMQRLYRSTVGQQGLVHAVRGPSDEEDNTYSVDLAPVGLCSGDALPRNEMEARDMIHGLLHGLAALHKAGFVHRDLRWDNVACCAREPRRWFLIDLECSAAADAEVLTGFQLMGWETGVTLVNGRYTRESDIYQLGRLVEKACERLELSDAAKEFMSALLTRPTQQRSSAARLLSNKWISCVGAACRAAGAQPGER